MNDNKTHWRKAFHSDYLSSLDIPDGKDLVLTIKQVKLEQITNQQGKSDCNVAHFEEAVKPMVLNVTNSKVVRSFANNSNFLEDWQGIKVQLYVKSNVKFGKEVTDAIRIREFRPKATVKIDPKDAIQEIQSAGDLETLKTIYSGLSRELQAHPEVIKAKDELKEFLS